MDGIFVADELYSCGIVMWFRSAYIKIYQELNCYNTFTRIPQDSPRPLFIKKGGTFIVMDATMLLVIKKKQRCCSKKKKRRFFEDVFQSRY